MTIYCLFIWLLCECEYSLIFSWLLFIRSFAYFSRSQSLRISYALCWVVFVECLCELLLLPFAFGSAKLIWFRSSFGCFLHKIVHFLSLTRMILQVHIWLLFLALSFIIYFRFMFRLFFSSLSLSLCIRCIRPYECIVLFRFAVSSGGYA